MDDAPQSELSCHDGKLESPAADRITKQEFGRRLQGQLDQRGWSQADLVRAVHQITPANADKKMGRDAISTYINGRSFPTLRSLNLLCKALGVEREALAPQSSRREAHDGIQALELRMLSDPDKVWLQLNRCLSFETAMTILNLVNENDTKWLQER